MANLFIKGVPDPLYREIKKRAQREFRSLNQQVIWILFKEVTEGEESYSSEELDKLEKFSKYAKGSKVVKNRVELRQYLDTLKR